MSEPAESAALAAEPGPGRMLAQMRSERGLSVADVAQRLKYGVRQIEALEAEEFGKLPGTTFVRGMIRGYAKLLDVDPQPVLKALERRHIPAEITVDLRAKRIPFPDGAKRGTPLYLVLSLLALVAVLGVLYERQGGTFSWTEVTASIVPAPKPQVADASPAPKPGAAVAPAVKAGTPPLPVVPVPQPAGLQSATQQSYPGEGRVEIEFDSESWVEIKDKDGNVLMSQLNPGGTKRVVEGRPPLSLVIGNAGAVRVSYNGNPVDLTPHIRVEVARLTLN
ncbi:MAG: helix-turn-helix domain-containing protein [Burkholderiales bacterium]